MSDHLPESFSLASILAEQGVHRQEGLWVRWLAKDNPETNSITLKLDTAKHIAVGTTRAVLLGSLTCCSLSGCPFPIKSLALSAHVYLQTIHFQVLDKSPVSGPERGPTSCNNLSLKDCLSDHSEGLLHRDKGGARIYRNFCNKTQAVGTSDYF